jgi:2'-5' RNA ligase
MDMYYVALILPEILNEKVLYYKQMMLDKYGCKVGLKSPAHITMIPPFWMHPDKEPSLISDLDRLSSGIQPFTVRTNNFSAFKPRTLFIAVADNQSLSLLKSVADNHFKGTHYGIKTETRPFHPHITIATRDLFKKDFADAWNYFSDKNFEEEWTATGLSLLKHNKKNWDVYHTSQFKNIDE